MRDLQERLEIMAQCAYKIAGHVHVQEMAEGAAYDREHLARLAKDIANDIFKLAKLSGGPSTAEAGGPSPQRGPSAGAVPPAASAPSCPRCNEPMEFNPKWTGYDKKPKWRCSQRGKFVPDKGWSGCDGAKWEDAA